MNPDYIPGEGCECSARCGCECGCDVDWTPREVYELREQRDKLLEEREQWRMSSVCRELREQRDRMAEALRELCETLLNDKPRDITESLYKAGDALAAVKGWCNE